MSLGAAVLKCCELIITMQQLRITTTLLIVQLMCGRLQCYGWFLERHLHSLIPHMIEAPIRNLVRLVRVGDAHYILRV